MKIKSVRLNRFRGYDTPVRVEMDDLCVLIGRNDIGKSTFLEALDIFFNEGKGCIKIDKEDINKKCVEAGNEDIEIEVEFTDLPDKLIIDATNETSLREEFLLTLEGTLKILKRYPSAGKEKVFIKAHHPANKECRDLLLKKISDLRKILDDQKIECPDRTKSAEIRKAIWGNQSILQLEESEIEIAKIDSKNVWEQLKGYMPLYTLFQSDRKNTDSDDEVQDPMRIAVKEILSETSIQRELSNIAEIVKGRLETVAERTLAKLNELNPDIAKSLDPNIPDPANLKWADVFKGVSISGDDDIPINKRGSGVKRLVLISFFRAEAERRQAESNLPNIIYAIEEPETSQHPDHQRGLTDALIALSKTRNTQVILTTHSPEIVKRLKFEDIVLVTNNQTEKISRVQRSELPYPSLNEVNFAAFGEATHEYHNELYGYIEAEGRLSDYKNGRPLRKYMKIRKNGSTEHQEIPLTEYIRHQIHHPENTHNAPFTPQELCESIQAMRLFIKGL
ncbi:ATP-binding protein [Ideonella sp. B508-1]|uniref:ATP-binding protein n=1 Tax=Ideonella sp. B508-1 TaxID=137716 RepID=UPI000A01EB3A|nr:ATP-binding protein [Ideonella sp. B508-1]